VAILVLTIILSALALLFWLQTVGLLSDLSSGDAAGRGMAQGFAAIGIILVWLLLGVLAIIAYAKGTMPGWAALAALILIPASAAASFGALDLLTRPSLPPHYWPIVVPVLVPPLVVAFCFWALLPSLNTRVPGAVAAGVVWGAVLLLCLAIIPMQQVRQRVLDAREAARVRFDAELKAVPVDAPLEALTPFLGKGDYVQNEEVIARMRKLPRRQAEAEQMLARGDFPLAYLGRLDLTPTPSLCEKSRALLQKRASALMLTSGQSKPFAAIAQEAQDAVAALRWLIDYDCPAMPEAEAWETMAKAYSDPSYTIYELRDLKDPKRLGRALYEDPEHFSMLTPRAHLKAWLKFADDEGLRAPAIEGARKLDHRTQDAIEMFGQNEFGERVLLENLARLDLEATPSLCRAALGNLRKQFARIYRPEPNDPRDYRELLGRLGRGDQLNALIWLASNGCEAQAELRETISLIKAYQPSPDSGLMVGRLEALQKK
jgi:hypothetical protein